MRREICINAAAVTVLVATLVLVGCALKARIYNLDTGQVLVATFNYFGSGKGPIEITLPSAHAQALPGGCPGRWINYGGGMACQCPDGSLASGYPTISCGGGGGYRQPSGVHCGARLRPFGPPATTAQPTGTATDSTRRVTRPARADARSLGAAGSA